MTVKRSKQRRLPPASVRMTDLHSSVRVFDTPSVCVLVLTEAY